MPTAIREKPLVYQYIKKEFARIAIRDGHDLAFADASKAVGLPIYFSTYGEAYIHYCVVERPQRRIISYRMGAKGEGGVETFTFSLPMPWIGHQFTYFPQAEKQWVHQYRGCIASRTCIKPGMQSRDRIDFPGPNGACRGRYYSWTGDNLVELISSSITNWWMGEWNDDAQHMPAWLNKFFKKRHGQTVQEINLEDEVYSRRAAIAEALREWESTSWDSMQRNHDLWRTTATMSYVNFRSTSPAVNLT